MVAKREAKAVLAAKGYLFTLVLLAALLAAFVLLAATAVAQNQLRFEEDTYSLPPLTLDPVDIANADFDRDGDIDLVTANNSVANIGVTVFQNINGSGIYTDPGQNFIGGGSASAIAVGDFDNDNLPDIVSTDPITNVVQVFLNTSTTSNPLDFVTPPISSLFGGDEPVDVAVGDFNDDNMQDLAVTNDGSTNNVVILQGLGDGNFTPVGSLNPPVPFSSPQGVDIGNFDDDQDPDLAVTDNVQNTVSIFLGFSNFNFGFEEDIAVGKGPEQVITADFNDDGDKDIAASNFDSDNVSVALGNGDGTFDAPENFAAGDGPLDLAAADYNRDGDPDIAVENFGSDNVSVLRGKGDGTFASPVDFPVDDMPSGLTSSNFDEENGPDLATSNLGSDNMSVLLNDTPVPPSPPSPPPSPPSPSPSPPSPSSPPDDNSTVGQDDAGTEEGFAQAVEDIAGVEDTFADLQYTIRLTTPDGVAATTDGTTATAADGQYTDPDTQGPVSGPRGDVLDEVNTAGSPLPPTGGGSLPGTGGLPAAALAVPLGLALMAGGYVILRFGTRRR